MRTARRSPKRRTGRPPQTDSEETRARILETASVSFALHGYADTAVGTVAEEAGVTSGTVYYYFASKAGLYEAVATEARARLNDRLIDPLLSIVAEQPALRSRLTTLVTVLVHRAGEDIALHRLGIAGDLEAERVPAVRAFRDGLREDLRRLYTGVAGFSPDERLTPKQQELTGFVEMLTLGVWHFAVRPNGLERLPIFVRAFEALLDDSLFRAAPR